MMKLLFSILFISSAAAFSGPSAFRASRASRSAAFMTPDPEFLNLLSQHADAVRTVFLECDTEGCVMVSGYQDTEGAWSFGQGLEDIGRVATTRRVLMMDVEGCE
mmetsp:Transcript_12366/g.16214  ORF Transcript_12366/g.16214 Transcript_12366/m.16214 type:complete len:105 (-) Transcript_12366:203-517(-)|eukprot:CAMPEP_0198136510 /NCGR_PEP_ID=MMETSP1443-20131203/154_1 /TAXON_ID=186043 /ORGANISM="Entomoneis sp., Strain CCMP2396" /LENGTH=104 /DNA_ID=CAMNT_0043797741 /DNA_START=126 /DNA_END=440 /DNA_ORIENTATION=-